MKITIICILLFWYNFQALTQNYHFIDSLKNELTRSKIDSNRTFLLFSLAYEYENYDNNLAQKYFFDALNNSKKINYQHNLSKIYSGIGRTYLSSGSFKNAKLFIDSSLAINHKLNDSFGIATDYDNLSIIYLNNGDINAAIQYREKALRIYEYKNNKPKISDALLWLGNFNFKKSLYKKALEYYFRSQEISLELNNLESSAMATSNCANVYRHQKNYKKALEYDSIGLKAFENLNRKSIIATIYMNIGTDNLEMGNLDQSLISYNKALLIAQEILDSNRIMETCISLGNYYTEKQDYNNSERYTLMALKISKLIGAKGSEAISYANLGSIESSKENYLQSNYYFLKSLNISTNLEGLTTLSYCYQNLSSNYQYLNDFKNALRYYKLYKEIEDSILHESTSKNILELQVSYESEKKDKEIETLQIQDRLTKEKNDQKIIIIIIALVAFIIIDALILFLWFKRREYLINKQLLEVKREALNAQMSDHFVGNTIDSINTYIEDGNKIQATEYLKLFRNLIRTVLENSLEKLIPIEKDFQVLISYLELEKLRFRGSGLNYNIEIDKKIDAKNTLIPPMIFQVLVENCITHGFSKSTGGSVYISIFKDKNILKCSVEDNGTGRKSKPISSSANLIVRKSIGTELAKKLVFIGSDLKKDAKSFNIIDKQDNEHNTSGTKVEFTLPYQEIIL